MKLGKHIIVDFFGCNSIQLENLEEILEILVEGVKKSGATIINTMVKKFEPQGGTILILLAESHLSFHSYPEFNSVMIDIFTCGDKDPLIIYNHIKEKINHIKEKSIIIERGHLENF